MRNTGLLSLASLLVECTVSEGPRTTPTVLAEWEYILRTSHKSSLEQKVTIWSDHTVETWSESEGPLGRWKGFEPNRKVFPLAPGRLFELNLLLGRTEFLWAEPEPRFPGCPGEFRPARLSENIRIAYSPVPGVTRKHVRKWVDGEMQEPCARGKLRAGLEALDDYFRGLLWN